MYYAVFVARARQAMDMPSKAAADPAYAAVADGIGPRIEDAVRLALRKDSVYSMLAVLEGEDLGALPNGKVIFRPTNFVWCLPRQDAAEDVAGVYYADEPEPEPEQLDDEPAYQEPVRPTRTMPPVQTKRSPRYSLWFVGGLFTLAAVVAAAVAFQSYETEQMQAQSPSPTPSIPVVSQPTQQHVIPPSAQQNTHPSPQVQIIPQNPTQPSYSFSQLHSMDAPDIVTIQDMTQQQWQSAGGSPSYPFAKAGTGFYLPNGDIVTCYHVVDGGPWARINIKGYSGAPSDLDAKVVWTDPTHDLAILQQIGQIFKKPAGLPLAATYRIGEAVGVLGHPGAEALTMTTGNITGTLPLEDVGNYGMLHDMIEMNAPVVGGSSGSPVLNSYGQVVGIVESAGAHNGNVSFAVPSKFLSQFFAGG